MTKAVLVDRPFIGREAMSNMRSVLKIILIVLMLGSVSITSVSCSSKSASAATTQNVVTVSRGNLEEGESEFPG